MGYNTKKPGVKMSGTPYFMYGEESDPIVGESPLAKTGCAKKYKKSGIKKYKKSGVKAMGDVDKPKYTTVKNEDGTETNISVKTRKFGKRKGEVKKTVVSLVGTDPYGDKIGLASIKSKPGKEDKTSGSNKALADLRNYISNKNLAQSFNG